MASISRAGPRNFRQDSWQTPALGTIFFFFPPKSRGNLFTNFRKHFGLKTFRVVSFSIFQSWLYSVDGSYTGAWAFLSAQNHLLHHWDAVPQIFWALSNSHDFSRAALFTWNILPWNTTMIRPYYSFFVLCSTLSHTPWAAWAQARELTRICLHKGYQSAKHTVDAQ